MSSAALANTTVTVAGTPTVFLPLATPWPLGADCTSNIYLHSPVANVNTFLAWDPLYGAAMVTSAQSCLPPQVSVWWDQTSSSIYTALGPAFRCPEAYSAVQTAIVASSLHQTFCCPSQYSLFVPLPNVAGAFPSQCISTVTSGQKFVHITSQGIPGQATTTVVMTSSATVFAIPVNGFDFAPSTAASSLDTLITPPPAATSASTSTSVGSVNTATAKPAAASAGVHAGIAVGVVGAVAIVAGVAFLLFRRWRQKQAAERYQVPIVAVSETPKDRYELGVNGGSGVGSSGVYRPGIYTSAVDSSGVYELDGNTQVQR